MWGDTIGFAWGQRNERTEVPIVDAKQRQSYYGVVNPANQEVKIAPYERGNGENTVAFIKQLQALYPNKKPIIIRDGASCHDGQEVREYLSEINRDLEEKDRKVACLFFAPHAPDQNPVEDVWLQGKTFCEGIFMKTKLSIRSNNAFLIFSTKKFLILEKQAGI